MARTPLRVAAILLGVVCPMMTRAYAVDLSEQVKSVKFPNPYCQAIGQFLPHPTDRCQYLRCTYGSEPWRDEHGRIVLFSQTHICPPGTSVNRTLFFYPEFGASNEHFYYPVTPCTIVNRLCVRRMLSKPISSSTTGSRKKPKVPHTSGDHPAPPESRSADPEYVQPEDTVVSPETHRKFAIPFDASSADAGGGGQEHLEVLVSGGKRDEGERDGYGSGRRTRRRQRNMDEYGGEEGEGEGSGVEGRKSIPARIRRIRPRGEEEQELEHPEARSTGGRRGYGNGYGGVYNDRAMSVGDGAEEVDEEDAIDEEDINGNEEDGVQVTRGEEDELKESPSDSDITDESGNAGHTTTSTPHGSNVLDNSVSRTTSSPADTNPSPQDEPTDENQQISTQPDGPQVLASTDELSDKMRPYFYYVDSRSYVYTKGKHPHKELLEKWSKAELSKKLRPALIHDNTGTRWVEPKAYEIPVLLPLLSPRLAHSDPAAARDDDADITIATTPSDLSAPEAEPLRTETRVNAVQAAAGAVAPESAVSFGGNVLREFLRHRVGLPENTISSTALPTESSPATTTIEGDII